jgi:site-specific recombinase XerD
MRFIDRWRRDRNPSPDDFVFLNSQGRPWKCSALCCRMRRLRKKLGFKPDDSGEQIVTYTLRHSGATEATIEGIQQRALADVMGHTTTDMTQRYQHLKTQHLHRALSEAKSARRRRA